MDYRLLLDPKSAAAKEKSKKRTPNYGPQQARKQAPTADAGGIVNFPRYDPKALLNPKAAALGRSSTASAVSSSTSDHSTEKADSRNPTEAHSEPQAIMGSLLGRLHNVQQREASHPAKKRKTESVDDTSEDTSSVTNKLKSAFTGGGSGGIIGQGLKEQRERLAKSDVPLAIDLTEEADEEDDVVFVSETTNKNDSQEICLGKLSAQVHAFRIPASPKFRRTPGSSDMWPMDRISFKRVTAQNNVIDVFHSTASDSNIGEKFGNLDPKVASALCPLIDGNSMTKFRIRAFIDVHRRRPGEQPGQGVSKFIPVSVVLYSPRKFKTPIGRHLSQKQLFLSPPPKIDMGIEYENPHAPRILGRPATESLPRSQNPNATFVSRTNEEIIQDALSMFDALTKSEDLPEKETSNDIIRTPLLPHQKQALHFMSEHESADSMSNGKSFSLWQTGLNKGRPTWTNTITGHEVHKVPPPARGGILADMMGLGKTLSILTLATDSLEEAKKFGEQEAPIEFEMVERNAKATLVICPKSVMANWEAQIKEHTHPGKVRVYAYHGPSRTQDTDELANYDFVLATYNTAQIEWSDKMHKRNALASINWFRIVLDEGHQIRNASTAISKACCALSAQRRWAVTGTPVQNRLDDLAALIRFLRVKPFDEDQNWAQFIAAPLRTGKEFAIQHLRLLVDTITLRRMKDRIDLPPREQRIVRLQFTDEEQVAYTEFARQANTKLRIMIGEKQRLQGKSYAHVLRALGRLRMICAHGREMLTEEDQRELEGLTVATAIDLGDEIPEDGEPDDTFITPKHAYETFQMMAETEANLCTGCGVRIEDKSLISSTANTDDPESTSESDESELDDPENDILAYLNPCYHLFCPPCKEMYIEHAAANRYEGDAYHNCMHCEQYIRYGIATLLRSALRRSIEARTATSKNGQKARWNEHTYSGPHTKVRALLAELHKSAKESSQLPLGEPPIRSVVFSGWTQYLDLIEHALDKNEIISLRLDGKMSIKARSTVLQQFADDTQKATVLLVSIKAGGQGLNFTTANKVYMMEPQFNPGVEEQAIDRVHRLGQTRPVEVTHYIMAESVEESILKLQQKKQRLAKLTMERKLGKVDGRKEARERIEELKDLFR